MSYLYRDEAIQLLEDVGNQLCDDVSHVSETLLRLLDEDDWSFTIKAHALIESSLADLILVELNEPRLESYVRKLPIANEATGKLGLAKRLELVASAEITCIRKLSTVRNLFAHDLRHIDSSLESYIDSLSPSDSTSLRDALLWFVSDNSTRNRWREIFLDDPKVVVWLSVFLLVTNLIISRQEKSMQIHAKNAADRTTEDLLADALPVEPKMVQ